MLDRVTLVAPVSDRLGLALSRPGFFLAFGVFGVVDKP